jgi:hypothetical protein
MLTKKPKTPVTTSNEVKLQPEKAVEVALSVLGQQFTEAFIASQKDSKISGFKTDAECCRQKVKNWDKSKLFFIFLLLLTVSMGYITYTVFGWNGWTLLTLVLTSILGSFTAFYGNVNLRSYDKPGTTEKLVAKAWKPVRKVAIENAIVGNMASVIEFSVNKGEEKWVKAVQGYRYHDEVFVSHLAYRLESELIHKAQAVKDAERDGQEGKRNKSRKSFDAIHKLADRLGYTVKDWGYYFSQS